MPAVPTVFWPDHWYDGPNRVRCIVPYCGFKTANPTTVQWEDLLQHCTDTEGIEHALLGILLEQRRCAIDDCGYSCTGVPSYMLRMVFEHEKDVHRTAAMSGICSFVVLAREGRIRFGRRGGGAGGSTSVEPEPDCERLAFLRMMEKVQALPAEALDLLFRKSGFDQPHQQTPANLGKILTHDHLAQPGDDPPFWWPVRAEHFLWFCRPDPTLPADEYWRNLWSDLRAKYADGRI